MPFDQLTQLGLAHRQGFSKLRARSVTSRQRDAFFFMNVSTDLNRKHTELVLESLAWIAVMASFFDIKARKQAAAATASAAGSSKTQAGKAEPSRLQPWVEK